MGLTNLFQAGLWVGLLGYELCIYMYAGINNQTIYQSFMIWLIDCIAIGINRYKKGRAKL